MLYISESRNVFIFLYDENWWWYDLNNYEQVRFIHNNGIDIKSLSFSIQSCKRKRNSNTIWQKSICKHIPVLAVVITLQRINFQSINQCKYIHCTKTWVQAKNIRKTENHEFGIISIDFI
jgi:hypothetical protein